MSLPLHLPEALLIDIESAQASMPATMPRSAVLRRLLRAGLLAEGHTLSERREDVLPREWPATRRKPIPTCSYCPAQSKDSAEAWYCTLDPGERDVGCNAPPAWCPLRDGPVVLRLVGGEE